MAASFLFYDLETFGADPRRSRIAQFAAIRTDEHLRQIEQASTFFIRPADDLLPSPEATLVTGITPQYALQAGIDEADAFARIFEQMARPHTTTLGYNNLRFDDEFIRHGLFRNFHDPYAREWRGNNSRWDLLDVMRLAHALRPDGIEWPQREDGLPSFRLDDLAAANGVRDGDAHEALSDVRALIGIARRLRQAQPKLWEYALRLRDKRHAGRLLDPDTAAPVLHISQRYPAARLCAAPVLALARHPQIENRIIVYDLEREPDELLTLAPEAIAERLFQSRAKLAADQPRIGLKEVHLNRSPALVQWAHLRNADFQRLRIEPAQALARAERLRAAGPDLAEKIRRVYARPEPPAPADVDASLYDGFLPDQDRPRLDRVRATPPAQLGRIDFGFSDPRLPELLFRYRARNWPDTLNVDERRRWDAYRQRRLQTDADLAEPNLAQFHRQLETLRQHKADDQPALALLEQLRLWGRKIEDSLQ